MTFFATLDDVSSAVIDIGREETRAGKLPPIPPLIINSSSIGYSGEDCPRSMIPSLLGVLEGEAARQPRRPANTDDAEMVDEAVEVPKLRYISGRTEIGRKRDHMTIKPLFQEDGMSTFLRV